MNQISCIVLSLVMMAGPVLAESSWVHDGDAADISP